MELVLDDLNKFNYKLADYIESFGTIIWLYSDLFMIGFDISLTVPFTYTSLNLGSLTANVFPVDRGRYSQLCPLSSLNRQIIRQIEVNTKQKQTKNFADFITKFRGFSKLSKIEFCQRQIFKNSIICFLWGPVMSHKKIGSNLFSRFDVYWIQTNKQTPKQTSKVY